MNHSNETLTVDFPETLQQSGIDQTYIKEAVAAVSYYNGRLSEKEACDLLNVSRRTFEEMILPKFGLSLLGGKDEDVEIEVRDL